MSVREKEARSEEFVTRGMDHRRPDPACPLCPVWGRQWDPQDPDTWGRQHEDAERLWAAWNPTVRGSRKVEEVVRVAAEMGLECSIEQALEHFSDKHRIEQPMYSKPLNREHHLSLSKGFSETALRIAVTLHRQRGLMTRQIQEVFYRGRLSPDGAKQAARKDLMNLAQAHFIYRYFPSDQDTKLRHLPLQFSKSALWFLGKAASPYIEKETGSRVYSNHYVSRAREVKRETLIHDLWAAEVFVSIARQLNANGGLIKTENRGDLIAEVDPLNWYGPRHLGLAFFDRIHQEERQILPDGFASLSLHNSGSLPNCQLPFFYEYDHGSRSISDVVGQLMSYHFLALSGAAGKRFPELEVPGYTVPCLMVFSDKRRLKSVRKKLSELAQREGVERISPIWLAGEKEFLSEPLTGAFCRSVWDDEEKPFIELLISASAPLVAEKALAAGHALALDPDGARPRAQGSKSDEAMAEVRDKQARSRRKEASRQQLIGILERAIGRRLTEEETERLESEEGAEALLERAWEHESEPAVETSGAADRGEEGTDEVLSDHEDEGIAEPHEEAVEARSSDLAMEESEDELEEVLRELEQDGVVDGEPGEAKVEVDEAEAEEPEQRSEVEPDREAALDRSDAVDERGVEIADQEDQDLAPGGEDDPFADSRLDEDWPEESEDDPIPGWAQGQGQEAEENSDQEDSGEEDSGEEDSGEEDSEEVGADDDIKSSEVAQAEISPAESSPDQGDQVIQTQASDEPRPSLDEVRQRIAERFRQAQEQAGAEEADGEAVDPDRQEDDQPDSPEEASAQPMAIQEPAPPSADQDSDQPELDQEGPTEDFSEEFGGFGLDDDQDPAADVDFPEAEEVSSEQDLAFDPYAPEPASGVEDPAAREPVMVAAEDGLTPGPYAEGFPDLEEDIGAEFDALAGQPPAPVGGVDPETQESEAPERPEFEQPVMPWDTDPTEAGPAEASPADFGIEPYAPAPPADFEASYEAEFAGGEDPAAGDDFGPEDPGHDPGAAPAPIDTRLSDAAAKRRARRRAQRS